MVLKEKFMQIISFDPENTFYRKQFIEFAFDLYHDNPFWVPPILMDLKTIFKPNKHWFY